MSTLEATRPGTQDMALMEEMVAWIKGLREAGVSADKAAEVSKDIMIALLNSYAEDEDEEYEDDEEE